jgi:hypothetical protein
VRAVRGLGQRPQAGAAQVALDLGADRVRRLEPRDPRPGAQVVREPALEVLARRRADRRGAAGLDVDVDRPPPDRVRARVGERVEDGIRRRGDVPLVDEQVLASVT